MKFTHQIKFNSVPEWREHYIHYGLLKKILYQIAKADADILASGTNATMLDAPVMQDSGFPADAEQPLLPRQYTVMSRSQEFEKELDREVGALIQFYLAKEAELIGKLEAAELEVHSMERQGALGSSSTPPSTGITPSASVSDLQLEAGGMHHQERLRRIRHWAKPMSKLFGGAHSRQREKLKGRLSDIFVGFHDLINFLDLNKEGLRKILKKHDKVTGNNLRERYWREVVDKQYPSKNKAVLEAAVARILDQYAVLFMNGDIRKAQDQLSQQLRDQIQVERNTVWRDMVAMERRTLAASVRPAIGGSGGDRPWWRRHGEWLGLSFSLFSFFVMLSSAPFDTPEKNNCLALLVFVSLLWSTEALPLFVTSMLLPLLIVALRVLVDHTRSPAERLTPQDAAAAVFHAMFSQVIMLLLGGFAIAAALSKHFIAKQVAIAVLSRVGRKPQNVLLACMMVATFASMWISNVAAPVLCFSLVQPILRTLDTSHPFAKALVIGIALASNIGGMTSPISSPQNIFAIERMSIDGPPPTWLQWFAVALPVSITGNLLCWAGILFVYQPWRSISEVRPLKPSDDLITGTQIYVILVSLATVALWCANGSLQSVFGEMGVVAIVPLVGFFGFGILNKDDFNGFLWNVVMLAMGGLALGEAVKSSGLLAEIAGRISILVAGMDLWAVTATFCALVLVCTTFISHTVGAMVILPIVQSVGEQMTGTPHPKLLVMAAALMCSGAMGLPVSGFPNMNAVALEDTTGTNYISTVDFLKVGVPGSIAAYGVIVSLGYCLMQLVGL